MNKIVVFTDLDGTLLDEETYSAEVSLPALRELQANSISIIFCSSKTRAEQKVIRKALGVEDPFIVENGSAIIVPPNNINIIGQHFEELDGTKILVLGAPFTEIRAALKQVVSRTGIAYQSFHDLSHEQITQITGLNLDAAKRAKNRVFSETIVTKFSLAEQEFFIRESELYNLHCTVGGRFLSVIGKGADKGKAVRSLATQFENQFSDVITIGIGDSPNDAPMLQEVDFPYLVQRPNGQWRNLNINNLNYLPAIGPFSP